MKIKQAKGNKSQMEKEGLIQKLLFDTSAVENKYIIRFIDKNLKVGSAEKAM